MLDAELIASIKESFANVHMNTGLDSVLRLGRARRTRHRLARLLGVTVAGGVLLATSALVAGSRPGTGLDAWTVARQPDHGVTVTIRELRDPARLQRELRADGVPATVRFDNQNPQTCLYYPGSPSHIFTLLKRIFPGTSSAQLQNGAAFDIDTSAIPRGVGLWLNVYPPLTARRRTGGSVAFATGEALVYASGQCPSS
jgi:hypothetical protein